MRVPPLFLVLLGACSASDSADSAQGSPPGPCSLAPSWGTESPPLVDGDFAQFRLEPTHAGRAPAGSRLGQSLSVTWTTESYAIGDYTASKGSPSVVAGRVYAGFDDGYLRVFDAETGAFVWDYRTRQAEIDENKDPERTDHQGIHGTPAIVDGIVFIGAYDGWLYALSEETGELIWEAHPGDSVGASPTVADGKVFLSVEYDQADGKLWIFDADNGCVYRETPFLGSYPHSSTTVDLERGRAFVGANNGRFHAYDYENDETFWDVWMGEDIVQTTDNPGKLGDVKSTAAVVDDTAYITSWDGKVHAVDIASGETRFTGATNGRIMSSPSVSATHGVVVFGSHDGRVRAFPLDQTGEGEPLWVTSPGGVVTSSPTLIEAEGTALVGSRSDKLLLLDLADGAILWEHDLGSPVTSVPTVVGSTVYVTTDAGEVWRFDAD